MIRIRDLSSGHVTEYPTATCHTMSEDGLMISLFKSSTSHVREGGVILGSEFVTIVTGHGLVATILVPDRKSIAIEVVEP